MDGLLLSDQLSWVVRGVGSVAAGLQGSCLLMNGFGAVISHLRSSLPLYVLAFSLLHMRERDEAEESLSTALHTHSIERNTQKPGFGMKVYTAGGTGRINAFQSLEKGILGKIL